jgi:hypothetical protein
VRREAPPDPTLRPRRLHSPSSASQIPHRTSLDFRFEPIRASLSMGRLDHAITALDVLGSVVQAVPIVGDGLKSATEVAMKICETVKVR